MVRLTFGSHLLVSLDTKSLGVLGCREPAAMTFNYFNVAKHTDPLGPEIPENSPKTSNDTGNDPGQLSFRETDHSLPTSVGSPLERHSSPDPFVPKFPNM